MPGTLFVCATPLGNLEDVSPRLLQTLRDVALICAEDTRHTHKLLSRFEIHTPLTSVQQHTSPAKIEALVAKIQAGEDLALVTDAGTPGVSDPGPVLVRVAAENGIKVSPIVGPCALVAVLSVSGFDAQRFSFLGFLPRKPGKIRKVFAEVLRRGETFVIYESPYRIAKTLELLGELAPEASVCAGRELTKQFEEILRGTPLEIAATLRARKEIRGEFSVAVEGTLGLEFAETFDDDEIEPSEVIEPVELAEADE